MRNRWKRFDAEDREAGFTLIELMVVVLIIAILIAIAIPTFLGAREKAQDRAAQSNLRNALTAADTFYTNGSTYTAMDDTTLKGIEPSLTFVAGTSTDRSVGVLVSSDGNAVCLSTVSASAAVYWIIDAKTDLATHPAGTYFGKGGSLTTCDDAAIGTTAAVTTGFPS